MNLSILLLMYIWFFIFKVLDIMNKVSMMFLHVLVDVSIFWGGIFIPGFVLV